ncbi:hypothetical protein OHA98_02360 [Streptomyces sp. NBC_00654]|uniref:NAD(P)-dependent oxidoreductase n=1 Tax=Streptomyces sp. NBC_00654 TaxID=2975799 RepID=UPI002257BE5B|nr:NAD(P)-dependent oxidoreductase [Streptomyces sp. NBC_00654]MCX4963677.1 hypothetical protein [Streptomyces sp. NBC_00654]
MTSPGPASPTEAPAPVPPGPAAPPATVGLIGERELRPAKPSLRLVDTARGGIVDENALALALALKEGRVAGAALDVLEIDPTVGNPLLAFDSVVATPRLGAGTAEAQERAGRVAVEAVVRALTGGVPDHAVNSRAAGARTPGAPGRV